MPLKIRRTGSKEYGQYIKALIVGHAGAGKTLTGSTWPSPLYADSDGGLMSIADRGIPYITITSTEEMKELRRALDGSSDERAERFGTTVDTLVIDTFDAWQDIFIKERLRATKKDQFVIQDWGWLGERCKDCVNSFRNLPVNVVFLCHLRETGGGGEEDSIPARMPALSGAIREKITEYMDLSVVIRAQEVTKVVDNKSQKVVERCLITVPDRVHPWVKDRTGKLPREFEINFEDDYKRLQETMFAGTENLPDEPERDVRVPQVPQIVVPPPKTETKAQPVARARVAAEPPPGVDPETGEVLGAESPGQSFEEEVSSVEAPAETPLIEEAVAKVCADCGDPVNEREATISEIRFREPLDEKCFLERRKTRRVGATTPTTTP